MWYLLVSSAVQSDLSQLQVKLDMENTIYSQYIGLKIYRMFFLQKAVEMMDDIHIISLYYLIAC